MGRLAGVRAAAFVTAFCSLALDASQARASIRLCIEPTTTVPEDPSVVISRADLATFEAISTTGKKLPFTVGQLTDYVAWVKIEARDGTELRVSSSAGRPWCGRFRKLKVSRAYRADRRAPLVTAVAPGEIVDLTLRWRAEAWVKTEWAPSRAELEAGEGGVTVTDIGAATGRGGSVRFEVPDARRPLFLKVSLLWPDGSTGAPWTGWFDPGSGRFGAGLDAPFASAAPTAAACSLRRAWSVPTARFLIDGAAQRRFRAIDRRGRRVRTTLTPLDDDRWVLRAAARAGTELWLQELPASGGRCHGPLRVSGRRADRRPVAPGDATEVVSEPGTPIELHLAMREPTLWWELEVEWALTEAALRDGEPRKRVFRATHEIVLEYGADAPADFERLFLRVTPRFADGSEGLAWTGRVVRVDDGALRVEQVR